MKRFLILILVISAMLSAAFVPQDIAKQVAENYYKNYAPISEKGNEVANIFAHEYDGQITWYGVSFDKGFVIVTADDALKPILGYSFDGKLADPAKRDGGQAFKEWFGYMDKQVVVARKYNYADAKSQTEWKNIKNNTFPKASKNVVIDALVKSHWDQVWPWNDLCPEKDGTWTYVGCVATAASMILRYHEWPPTGTGSNTNSSAGTTETYSNYTFDYTQMKHDVVVEYGLYPEYWESVNMDAAALQNMAELNYLTGHSFDMSYGTTDDGGSGANMLNSANALESYWYYTANYNTVGTPTDPAYIASTIQAELDQKRPWWWAGGVHSFILDGYTDDAEPWYHFNWGWGGFQDGWFQINWLVPDDLGAGGGDGDYTGSQIRVQCIPDTDPFASFAIPTSFSGNVVDGEDVQLTWNGSADSYNVWKTVSMGNPFLLANTTNTYYNDNDLVEGNYTYFVSAVYAGGESHHTDSYNASIQASAQYPLIRLLNVNTVGRTNIDLDWTEPFLGTLNASTSFEDGGNLPSGWYTKKWGASWDDDTDGIISITTKEVNPHIVLRPGDYALIFSADGTIVGADYSTYSFFFLSPMIDMLSDTSIKFWHRFKPNPAEGADTGIRVVVATGDFSGTDKGPDTIADFNTSVDPINDYQTEVEVVCPGYAGQQRCVGIECYENDWFTYSIDDVLIGSDTQVADDPTGYEIYRNGSLATTINNGTTVVWSDTNFDDGDNTYFVRALYPGGESIPSPSQTVFMDANPKPDYLTGIFDGTDVDLSWYMPYGTPSHWASLIAPEDCFTTVDYAEFGVNARRRVEFHAEELGLYYPVQIDSIAGGFYEWSDDPWGTDNTFVIRLWEGDPDVGTLLYESGTLTATPGEIYAVDCGTQTLNDVWNIDIETFDNTNGFPSTLAGYSTTDGIRSFYYDTVESSYNWYISVGDTPLQFCMLAYVTGADPDPIAKSNWTAADRTYEAKPRIDKSGRVIENLVISNPKALDTYNVYKNDVLIGNTTTTTYTDLGIVTGFDYEYYVKASYANPTGLSEASNSVIIDTRQPADINLPASSVSASATTSTTDQQPFTIENVGEQDLTWSASYDYTSWPGMKGKGDITVHSNDFSSGLIYTNSGTTDWVVTSGQADLSPGFSATGIMTSPVFDGSGASELYLDFDQTYTARGSSNISVEYYNGSSWNTAYYATASTSGSQHISIPASAGMMLRFTGVMVKQTGQTSTWYVDNIVVSGPENIAYDWLRLDGAETANGVIVGGGNVVVNADCDGTVCIDGTYTADITITSDDADEPTVVLPITFTVGGAQAPEVPANVVTSISGSDLVIDWTASAGATSYDVYASDDPYAEAASWTVVATVGTNQYTVAASQAKLFYYIVAKN